MVSLDGDHAVFVEANHSFREVSVVIGWIILKLSIVTPRTGSIWIRC